MIVPDAFRMMKVLLASPDPVNIGVLSLVTYVGVISPPALVTVGIIGATESMMNNVVIGTLTFPTPSRRVTL
jgi:hypothetical protein